MKFVWSKEYINISTCPHFWQGLLHVLSVFFPLSAASEIIALAPCVFIAFVQDLYNTYQVLSSTQPAYLNAMLQLDFLDRYDQLVVTVFMFLG